jgi:hypothetical protein
MNQPPVITSTDDRARLEKFLDLQIRTLREDMRSQTRIGDGHFHAICAYLHVRRTCCGTGGNQEMPCK